MDTVPLECLFTSQAMFSRMSNATRAPRAATGSRMSGWPIADQHAARCGLIPASATVPHRLVPLSALDEIAEFLDCEGGEGRAQDPHGLIQGLISLVRLNRASLDAHLLQDFGPCGGARGKRGNQP